MMLDEQRALEKIQPLLNLIKRREQIFFGALGFANKNIESSSNQIDQITLFTNFIAESAQVETSNTETENKFLQCLGPGQQQFGLCRIANTSKQLMRLSGRVLEMLESSVEKTRNSLFSENGRLGIDFARFKKSMYKLIQQNPIELLDFCKLIINFSRNKLRRQVTRIRSYLEKLKQGENISFRDMYAKDGSDVSVSPDEKYQKKYLKKQSVKIFKEPDHSQSQSPAKKSSRRPEASKSKRASVIKNSKKQKDIHDLKSSQQRENKMQKAATAAQLLKFYAMMELHKKDFLEDYVFQKHEQQKQKKRLITELMQRNRLNIEQIKQYTTKCENFNPSIHLIANPNSDQNSSVQRNDSSANSRASIKTSFVISKRKQSFTFQSPSDRSDAELMNLEAQIPISRTIKNLSSKRRTSEMKSKVSQKSKKIFVVKSPLTFDDDVIPKAQVTQTGWIQQPLTGKQKGSRKNQSLRLKKRNNPCPIDEKFLPESFRFSQQPF